MRYAVGLLLLASPAIAGEPAYSWRSNPVDPDRVYLYQDGKQVGGWCYSTKQYRSFDGKDWGAAAAKAPTPPPSNRAIITPPAPAPMVMVPSGPAPQLRGPLRRRAGTIFADIMLDATMKTFEAIPGAILDSVKKGNVTVTGGTLKIGPTVRP